MVKSRSFLPVRPIVGALLAVVVAATACGGGPERSASAFCDELAKRAVELHSKYQSRADTARSQDDGLASLLLLTGTAFEAQGDMVAMLDALDQRAPDEIEPDVAALRDAFKAQQEAARSALSDPLGALGGGLISGLQSMGASARVESYIQGHCDLSYMHGQ